MYKHKHVLFRDLTDIQVEAFKEYTAKLCKTGFKLESLTCIHPVIRKELIRIVQESLKKQNEL